MFGLLIGGAVALTVLIVLGLLGAVASLVCWVFVLPFKLLGLTFKGLAFLLALPFMLLFGVLAAVIFGVGALVFAIPALPFVLLVGGIWWLMLRKRPARVV